MMFSVSARTREFGVRLAIGSAPRQLLARVLSEGALIAALGILAGAGAGYAFGRIAERHLGEMQWTNGIAVVAAATTLMCAALLASLMPAARASRVDVVQALRAE